MHKLLAKTAAAGAALSMGGSQCDRPPIVCDPLPPPINCALELTSEYLSQFVSRQVRWVSDGSGSNIEVVLTVIEWDTSSDLSFSGAPALEGGTLVQSNILETTATFVIAPLDGATTVNITVPVNCQEKSDALELILDTSGTPTAGGNVPVSVGE